MPVWLDEAGNPLPTRPCRRCRVPIRSRGSSHHAPWTERALVRMQPRRVTMNPEPLPAASGLFPAGSGCRELTESAIVAWLGSPLSGKLLSTCELARC
jgi:hypothetical protein